MKEEKNLLSSPPCHPATSSPYLQCHHCDRRAPFPEACPACGGEELAACGPGVERLLEEVRDFLPQARVAVMASDHGGGKEGAPDILAAMSRRQIDVLIGTQMIAKGHHFAHLAVVGIVDADLGLGGGDLRAAERSYQLLQQMAGRAGREHIPGKACVQSFLPDHPVMQALVSGDRDAFLAAELKARENAHMPPFSRLAAIIVEGEKEELVLKTAKALASSFPQSPIPNPPFCLYGPAPAPLYRLRGKFRHRLLIKAGRNVNLPNLVKAWVDALSPPASLRVKIDMDPMSFL